MTSDPLPLLKTTPLFSSCRDEDLTAIASHSGFITLGDGETVFSAGSTSNKLYIVHGGSVVIRKDDDEGRPVEIARFLPGDSFGELDMFTGVPRNADAFADGPASLLEFPSGNRVFGELEEIESGARARLLHSFLVQVSSRIRGVNALVKENTQVVKDLKKQVYVDKLTGLFNRTFFDETLDSVLTGSDTATGLLLYKPDNFKAINDSHGHDAGDKVLRLIADHLRDFVPNRDMLFRYMGNENAVILPAAGRAELINLAEQMGAMLRSLDLSPVLGDTPMKLSVSFGLAVAPEHGDNAASLCDTAHPLTLEGRRRGGNLILFPEDSSQGSTEGGAS